MSTQQTSNDQIHKIRHSASHMMAAAVSQMFPDVKLGIGPVIENGFYYDFELPRSLTDEDIKRIESKMKKLISRNIPFIRKEVTPDEARTLSAGQPYKLELIEELAENHKPITYYASGPFTDLCGGPHVASTKEINPQAVRLMSTAGAYWRGNEENTMLQRIYGVAFETPQELEAYIKQQEEIKRRDHRRLGVALDLFSFHPVAPGAPFWHPHGMIIFKELETFSRSMHESAGYQEISTPLLVKKELWERSGHWRHYQDSMFIVQEHDETYSLKPMNCPEATIVYSSGIRSYRDLPIRLSEIGRLHRNEISGALGGLFRVRQITMDDAHIFCTPEQIESEISGVIKMVSSCYKVFGLPVRMYLSTMPDEHLGTEDVWRKAEHALAAALKKRKIPYETKPKDGAFYGPKIDIEISDAVGRSWQVATIQLDFNLPERFELEYTDAHGDKQRPVMIHRAIYGSFERFIGILTEHYEGAFPVWLSPVQVSIIPVGKSHIAFSKKLGVEFLNAGIRAHVDDMNETVGYKIRNAEKRKVPYMIVIGDKEMQSPKLHVRIRGKKKLSIVSKKSFLERILEEIAKKKK
ncbi:MAG: threonine--tRNA ligase [Patescibacteria group bacterium]|jgi:threonyl-tRNA synthetase